MPLKMIMNMEIQKNNTLTILINKRFYISLANL